MRRTLSISALGFLLLFVLLPVRAGEVKETKSALETNPSGWINLLPGSDLKGWKRVSIPPGSKLKDVNPWSVKDGVLHCDGIGHHDMLLFDKELGDGIFHVEWRFQKVESKKGYNSGVYVRNSADGATWHQAQVGSQNVGHFFGSTPKGDKFERFSTKKIGEQRGKEAGEWNTFEITCQGPKVSLWVNGAVTTVWEECPVPRGFVGLESEGWVIEFKNLKFKELK